jgi:hypothetical protein
MVIHHCYIIFLLIIHSILSFQVEIHSNGHVIQTSGNVRPIQIIRVERRTNLNPNKESVIMTKIANMDAVFDAMIQRHVEIYFDFLNGLGRKRNEEEEKQKEEEIGDIDVSLDEDNNDSNNNNNSDNDSSSNSKEESSSLVVTPITNGKDDKVQTAKQKKKQIQHERKKVLFSKICKYIFYLLILFTCYFTVKQVIHLLNTSYNSNDNDNVTTMKQKTSSTSTQVIEEEEETKEMLELNEQQNKRHPNKLK